MTFEHRALVVGRVNDVDPQRTFERGGIVGDFETLAGQSVRKQHVRDSDLVCCGF